MIHTTRMADFHYRYTGRVLVQGRASRDPAGAPVLLSDVPLSFWGGIDPDSGEVVDRLHPLFGEQVQDTVLCLPSGRGSCTASQVLLELILRGKSPKAIVLRDLDGLVCVGALVAQEVFRDECNGSVPDIICLQRGEFERLTAQAPKYACIAADGSITAGETVLHAQNKERQLDVLYTSVPPLTKPPLTDEEQSMLDACVTEAEKMALGVVMRYARVITAPESSTAYLDVTKAHIDGCTYIGNGGLEFVQRLVKTGGNVKIPTTLNSVSVDRRRWQSLGVPSERALASIAVGDAYLALGCHSHSFTCAPYLLDDPPQLKENIVWGESNAVVYANSVLGARTEKYADYLDICCALVGKVPSSGVHLDEHRRPRIILDATDALQQVWDENVDLESLFPTLGHLCGTLSGGKLPILFGFDESPWREFVTRDHLKALCAAYGTTGTSPLIHIAGITPEAKVSNKIAELIKDCEERCDVTIESLSKTHASLDASADAQDLDVSLIALGNPHLSITECQQLAELIEALDISTKHPDVRIMACMSRTLYDQAVRRGYIQKLESFGVEFVNDTCWCMLLDSPVIPSYPDALIMTNSGKYAHYGPGLTGKFFRFGSMADCVHAAKTKSYPERLMRGANVSGPPWLSPFLHGTQRRMHSTVGIGRFRQRRVMWSILSCARRYC